MNEFVEIDERNIAARPLRFFKEYKPQSDGNMKEIEKIEWAPLGKAHTASTVQTIKEIRETQLWPVFEKSYEAWKKGDEIPVNGTPLAAWSGVTPEQAAILKASQIYTVEELANLTSTIKNRLRVPNIDNLCHLAGLFLETKDQRKFEEALQRKDEQVSEMQSRLAELEAMLMEKADAPKKRGRPPKNTAEEDQGVFQPESVDE